MAADIEALLVAWLTARCTDCRVVTETPDDLETIPRTIQVVRAGGGARFTVDQPRVVIHSYAIPDGPTSARIAARALAYRVNDLMRWTLPGSDLGGVYVGRTDRIVVSGPSWVPDPNTSLRHYVGTYAPPLSTAA